MTLYLFSELYITFRSNICTETLTFAELTVTFRRNICAEAQTLANFMLLLEVMYVLKHQPLYTIGTILWINLNHKYYLKLVWVALRGVK